MFAKPKVFRYLLTISFLLLSSCASWLLGKYGPDGQSIEEFEKRVEAAFRLQNKMTSEIMLLQDAEMSKQGHEPILAAEQTMQSKCSDLNEYASRDIDGQSKSLFLQRRVEQSVSDCEQAARLVETLINSHQR